MSLFHHLHFGQLSKVFLYTVDTYVPISLLITQELQCIFPAFIMQYLHQQKTKYQQWQKASDHHSLMLMKKVFRGYKCYHKRQLIKKDLTTQAISFYRHHILRFVCYP